MMGEVIVWILVLVLSLAVIARVRQGPSLPSLGMEEVSDFQDFGELFLGMVALLCAMVSGGFLLVKIGRLVSGAT